MPNNSYFYGQHKNEKLELYGYKHWFLFVKKSIGNVLLLFLTSALFVIWVSVEKPDGIGFFRFLSDHIVLSMIFYTWFLFHIHAFFLDIFNYFFDFIIVTDMRFIEIRQSVFFKNDVETIDLVKIQDAQAHSNGVFESIFDFGSLNLTFANIHDPKIIRHVPKPLKFIEFINIIKRRILFKHEQLEEFIPHKRQDDSYEDIVI